MFPYELRKGNKIFIVTSSRGFPELLIYEVLEVHEVNINGLKDLYTCVDLVNVVLSYKVELGFSNDVDLDKGEYFPSGVFRTTNEQLAIKVLEEMLETNSSQETPKT